MTSPSGPIRFAVTDTSVGPVVVGVTGRGVCAVLPVRDRAAAAPALGAEFSGAELVADEAGLADTLARVEAVIDRAGEAAVIELDLIGTPFQREVWTALRGIEAGTTWSYAELAERLGRPRAVRAVASACGRNHLAVLVPCHRVVRGDGGLGGYKWGLPMKRELLEREAAAAAGTGG